MAYTPKNPNGQATMANSEPVVIASNQTAVPVTASAGTNLNTSALALETGGNLASVKTNTDKIPVLGQAVMASSTPVAIASNQTAIPVTDNSGSLTVDNAGTFAVQVDGNALTALSSIITLTQITNNTIVADNAAFTDGTTKVDVAGYIFDEVAGTALTENDAAAARIDSKRAQVLVVEDATTRGQRQAVSAAGAASQNTTQVNSVTVSVNNGTANTGCQRVTIASDNTAFPVNATLAAETTKVIGTVNVAASQNVGLTPNTTNGLTVYHLASAASTNAVVVKSSAGQLYGWYIRNNNAAARKLCFHNLASTPTAGASIFFTLDIPAGSAANVVNAMGITFSTGIAITTVVGGGADTDSTAIALNDLNINLFYK